MNHSKTKQVIVIRRKYPDGNGGLRKVRTGKLMAQACHASIAGYLSSSLKAKESWNENGTAKIVAYVDSEEELDAIYHQCQSQGIVACMIVDAGRTEFKGPTKTAIGIGPWRASEIDKITGELPLL